MSDKSTLDALDTREARDKILSRIRSAQGRPVTAKDREEELSQSYISLKPPGPQPPIQGSLVEQFVAQSERLSATVAKVSSMAQVPKAVAHYLNERGLATEAVIWKSLAKLDWQGAGVSVEARAPYRDDPKPDLVGVTGCFAAIAETGTLAMLSGPDTPASMALLPETHIAVVPESRILAHMEEVFALLRHERGEPPRALNFISGPSRTADIEQTLVIGAHGPYRVHLILLANS
jgi:L-lactate dehydrogenase complex protein LldG